MSRIGFLTLYAPGHTNPALTLAQGLQDRGHHISYFCLLDTQPVIHSAGVRSVPFSQAEFPEGSLKEAMSRTAELSGVDAFRYYIERMCRFFSGCFASLPGLIKNEELDLLVIDQLHLAGGTIAEHTHVPYVSLALALSTNREPLIPPPTTLWPYEESQAAQQRNAQGWAAVDAAMTPLLSLINEQRRSWDLPDYTNVLIDSQSSLAQIAQEPECFDFPRSTSSRLHSVGHFTQKHDAELPFAWEWLDGRPVVYGTCGTIQNRLRHVFEAMIEACSNLHVQLVITLGRDGLRPDSFGQLPENVMLVEYAPQTALLSRAALCIHHGGLNTALDCLELGVPAVVIPIASEQPGIAMRLDRIGVAKVLPLPSLSGSALSETISAVLSSESCKRSTQSASEQCRRLHAVETAANIIEQAILSVGISHEPPA